MMKVENTTSISNTSAQS